jgi:hypothetical protein
MEQAMDGTAAFFFFLSFLSQQNLLQKPQNSNYEYFTLFSSGIHTDLSKTCWKWLGGDVALVLPTL